MFLLNIILCFLLFAAVVLSRSGKLHAWRKQMPESLAEVYWGCAVIIYAVVCVLVLTWDWTYVFVLNVHVNVHLNLCAQQAVCCCNYTKVVILMACFLVTYVCVYMMTLFFIVLHLIKLGLACPAYHKLIKRVFWFAWGLLFFGVLFIACHFFVLPNVYGVTPHLVLGVFIFFF